MGYERIVLRAEDHLIEAGDISCKGHARIVEGGIGRQLDRPQTLFRAGSFRNRNSVRANPACRASSARVSGTSGCACVRSAK